jgi:hypothetical protein
MGVLPNQLVGVDVRDRLVLDRFIKASIGWIRYKPLLTFITQPNDYERIIRDMTRKLDLAIPKLCSYFGDDRFEEVRVDLDRYHQNVRRHFKTFSATKEAWAKVTQAIICLAFIF